MEAFFDSLQQIFSTLSDPNIWIRLAIASMLLILLISLSFWQKINLEKKLLWSFLRGLIQIIILGSMLLLIFGLDQLWLLYLILLFMCFFAAYTNSSSYNYPRIFRINFFAITLSSLSVMTFAIFSREIPGFDGIIYQASEVGLASLGSYVIPVGSMTIFFAMRESGIALERVKSDILKSKGLIETALSLGANSRKAIIEILRDSYRASMVPTINRVAVLGIVTIPGLMSGMIIGGASPIEAAVYQIVVFMMLLAASFLASIFTNYFFTKQFFTKDNQFDLEFFNIISKIEKKKKKKG